MAILRGRHSSAAARRQRRQQRDTTATAADADASHGESNSDSSNNNTQNLSAAPKRRGRYSHVGNETTKTKMYKFALKMVIYGLVFVVIQYMKKKKTKTNSNGNTELEEQDSNSNSNSNYKRDQVMKLMQSFDVLGSHVSTLENSGKTRVNTIQLNKFENLLPPKLARSMQDLLWQEWVSASNGSWRRHDDNGASLWILSQPESLKEASDKDEKSATATKHQQSKLRQVRKERQSKIWQFAKSYLASSQVWEKLPFVSASTCSSTSDEKSTAAAMSMVGIHYSTGSFQDDGNVPSGLLLDLFKHPQESPPLSDSSMIAVVDSEYRCDCGYGFILSLLHESERNSPVPEFETKDNSSTDTDNPQVMTMEFMSSDEKTPTVLHQPAFNNAFLFPLSKDEATQNQARTSRAEWQWPQYRISEVSWKVEEVLRQHNFFVVGRVCRMTATTMRREQGQDATTNGNDRDKRDKAEHATVEQNEL